MLGYYVARAEDGTTTAQAPVACTMDAKVCPDGSFVGRVAPDCEFAKCPEVKNIKTEDRFKSRLGEIKDKVNVNREETQQKREEFRGEVKDIRGELEKKREEHKVEMQGLLDEVKATREEHRAEFELKREETKLKIDEIKSKFKENFAKIKDENKKLIAETIVTKINDLNVRLTDQLKTKVDQIENVLISIESRISKAKSNDIDVSSSEALVVKAKTAIEAARTAITKQAGNTYSVSTADDTTLKAEMKKLRDAFTADMKVTREAVKSAHTAVRNVAVSLAQIPNIDDDSSNKVEDNSTNNQ